MLPSFKKTPGTVTNVPSKREEKKRINIRWNSALFFQIGIIVSLLLTFAVMETTVGHGKDFAGKPDLDFTEDPWTGTFKIEPPKAVVPDPPKHEPKVNPHVTPAFNPDEFVVTDDPTLPETDMPTSEVDPEAGTSEGPSIPETPVIPEGPRNMVNVEHVPVFPGCESLSTNFEKTKCMSDKIRAFINRRFRTDEIEANGTNRQKIYVQFTIDRNGEVANLKARAPHPDLEKEAKRVVGKLPQMTPGRQGNKNVDVIYMVPIIYQVD